MMVENNPLFPCILNRKYFALYMYSILCCFKSDLHCFIACKDCFALGLLVDDNGAPTFEGIQALFNMIFLLHFAMKAGDNPLLCHSYITHLPEESNSKVHAGKNEHLCL